MRVAEFRLEAGGSVLVEVDESPHEDMVGRRADIVSQVGASFEQALHGIRGAAEAALDQFHQMPRRPDELEITFGVKLDTEMGAVIARTGIGGQLEVKLVWKNDGLADAKPPGATSGT